MLPFLLPLSSAWRPPFYLGLTCIIIFVPGYPALYCWYAPGNARRKESSIWVTFSTHAGQPRRQRMLVAPKVEGAAHRCQVRGQRMLVALQVEVPAHRCQVRGQRVIVVPKVEVAAHRCQVRRQ